MDYAQRDAILSSAGVTCAAAFVAAGGGVLPETVPPALAVSALTRALITCPLPLTEGSTRLTFRDAFVWAEGFTNALNPVGSSGDATRNFIASTRIRVATASDAPTIMGFVRELADFERALPSDVITNADVIAADGWGAEPAFHCFVAEVPRRVAEAAVATDAGITPELISKGDWIPVAIALAHPIYSTWMGRSLYLEDLYVTPWARRRGVSQLLFSALGRAAHAAGCARLQWSVLAWNTGAVDTYEAMAAERLEEWRLYRLYADGITRLAAGAVRAPSA